MFYSQPRPSTESNCMEIFEKMVKEVQDEIKLNERELYDCTKEQFKTPPEHNHAVVLNCTNDNITLVAFHNKKFAIGGGVEHNISAGKPNYVYKKKGMMPMFEDEQILIKLNDTPIQVLLEGNLYEYYQGAFEAKGSIQDWKQAMGL